MNTVCSIDYPEGSIDPSVFIAPGAVVVGDVTFALDASLWFAAVARGDIAAISVGESTNVQDGCVLHADAGEPCSLGARVTVGHGAIIHSATVEDEVLVGIRSTILNGARIGRGSIIAAGALVSPRTVIPPGSLVMGIPGKVVRQVTEKDKVMILESAKHYRDFARQYRERYLFKGRP